MGWIYLLIAGLFEIGWAVGMKYSEGFTKLLPSALTAAGMILTYIFLSLAVRTLPLGLAYAVWTGIGTVGATILGRVLFGEVLNLPQMLCIAAIIAGIIGLKMLASAK
ncbi:quaternary ammonium compound efflux SMR transporter SugE [Ignavibacteria bacterium]|nr:multidrug efflux SMR transporter [Bacteroidota bacterium]MCZ2133564.1 multidrug efflux SMR transporter [Bacteroidota bacterium]